MAKYDIYGMGNALVDMEFKIDDEFLVKNNIDKGLMTLVDADRQHEIIDAYDGNSIRACGGSAANTVIAAAQFGSRTYYSCRVADDEAGEFYLADLKENQVDCEMLEKAEGITGKCIVMVTPDAQRSMNTFLGITADYSKKDINENALKDSKWLYIEGYLVASPTAREAAVLAKRIADRNDVKTALTFSDPNMVEHFHSGMDEIIGSGVDLLFSNRDEALTFTKTDSIEASVEKLKKIAKNIAITDGANGAYVWDGDKLHHVKTRQIKPIDTNGAGDMFAGAFLYALNTGKNLVECAEFGCLGASHIVETFGPRLSRDKAKSLL